jgi:hypothetical protein
VKHIGNVLVALWKRLWELNNALGPLGALLTLGATLLVGFTTKSLGWGLCVFLGCLVLLLFWELVRRERERIALLTPTNVEPHHRDWVAGVVKKVDGNVQAAQMTGYKGPLALVTEELEAFSSHYPEAWLLTEAWQEAEQSVLTARAVLLNLVARDASDLVRVGEGWLSEEAVLDSLTAYLDAHIYLIDHEVFTKPAVEIHLVEGRTVDGQSAGAMKIRDWGGSTALLTGSKGQQDELWRQFTAYCDKLKDRPDFDQLVRLTWQRKFRRQAIQAVLTATIDRQQLLVRHTSCPYCPTRRW